MNRLRQWMSGVFVPVAALGAAACVQAGDATPVAPVASVAPVSLSDIQQRGRQLFLHERALAAATVRARASAGFRADARVQTALTRQTGDDQVTVTFVDDTPAALYRIVIDGEGGHPAPLQVFATPAPVDIYARQVLAARAQALAAGLDTCGRDTRTIVLPDADTPGQWQVYVLPQAHEGESIPVGGGHRIDTDGRAVLARHAFADTCVTVDRGPQSIGVMVAANPGEPAPSEAHVFWSLWAALPMFVGTDTGLWSISEGAIEPPTALNALHGSGGHDIAGTSPLRIAASIAPAAN